MGFPREHGYMRLPRAVKRTAAAPPAPDGAALAPPPPPAGRWRRRGRRALVGLTSLAAAAALLWLLRAPILTGVARFLTVHEPLRRADAIFVLGGDPNVRPFAAAALYRQGWAPRVWVPRMQVARAAAMGLQRAEIDVEVDVLRQQGVPDSAIVVLPFPGGTSSTTEDAEALRAYLRHVRARRVIAVTTDYHTRRARWALRRALRGTGVEVVLRGTPAEEYDETNWWRNERGLIAYFDEYVKFARYVIAGGAS